MSVLLCRSNFFYCVPMSPFHRKSIYNLNKEAYQGTILITELWSLTGDITESLTCKMWFWNMQGRHILFVTKFGVFVADV